MRKLIAVCIALLLLAGVAVGVSAQSGGAGFYDFETNVRMWHNLQVLGTTTFVGDIEARDDFTVTDQLVVSNDLTVADLVTAAAVRVTAPTTQTIVADGTITTSNSYLLLSAAGSVGTASIATCNLLNQGQIIAMENIANVTITLTDTGTLKLSGNAALAQFDTLIVFCDGTNWVEFAQQDN